MEPVSKGAHLRFITVLVVVIAAAMIVLVFGCQQEKQSKYHDYFREFSDQQWLAMVREPEHQPIAYWVGIGPGRVTETGTGIGHVGEGFKSTPAGVLEHHLTTGLVRRKPLLFLSLLDSKEPKLILTGIYIYDRGFRGPQFELRKQDRSKIEAAFRNLIQHKDARIRFMAIRWLGIRDWLNVDDAKRGLNDRSLSVRITTACVLHGILGDAHRYDLNGKLIVGDSIEVERLVDETRQLAPVFLDHLNDNHFKIRKEVAREFRAMFKYLVAAEGGGVRALLPDSFPKRIDWVRADWHTRDKAKEELKAWWEQRGEEALRFAHPVQ
ncbi:MAG TPA: hypothetical protein VMX13_11305 [Sedimentisphaerales bacterium]|nr:hypothetical protein [Sedimentisphaerales bacterium]